MSALLIIAKKGDFSIARELDVSDLHVEVIDLMNNRVEGEIGLGFFIAAFAALKKAPPASRDAGAGRFKRPRQH